MTLSGCAAHPDSAGITPTTTASVAPSTATPAPEQVAAQAAVHALEVWAQPGLDYDTWWSQLRPLLDAQGRQDYAYTDPTLIPALHVTGPAKVKLGTVDTAALVWVPTSAGTFGVELNRRNADLPWLVARFIFPDTKQAPPDNPSGTDTGRAA